jgi:hypothetical protein
MSAPARFDLIALRALVQPGCSACGSPQLRVRAVLPARFELLDGDVVSAPAFEVGLDALPDRAFEVDCPRCAAVLWQRSDCPRCRAPGRLEKALDGRNGVEAPRACPRCGLDGLEAVVELRCRWEALHGGFGRRIAEADASEGGWHVVEVHCPDCDEQVAGVGEARCGVCGRSALIRR